MKDTVPFARTVYGSHVLEKLQICTHYLVQLFNMYLLVLLTGLLSTYNAVLCDVSVHLDSVDTV